MKEQHSRTEMMLGTEGVDRLMAARVAVFGVGGVGGQGVGGGVIKAAVLGRVDQGRAKDGTQIFYVTLGLTVRNAKAL